MSHEECDTYQAQLEEEQREFEEECQQLEDELENIDQQNDLEEHPPEFDIDEVAPQIEVDELLAEYEMLEHEFEEFLPSDTILTLEEEGTDAEDIDEAIDDNSIEIGMDQNTVVLEVKTETLEVDEEVETYEIVDIERDIHEEGLESLDRQEVNMKIEGDIWEEFEEYEQILEENQELELSNIDQAIEELITEVELTEVELLQLEKELEPTIDEELITQELKENVDESFEELEEIKQQEESLIDENDNVKVADWDYEEYEVILEDNYEQVDELSEAITTEASEYEEMTIDQESEEKPLIELEYQADKEEIAELNELEEGIEKDEEISELSEIINDVQSIKSDDDMQYTPSKTHSSFEIIEIENASTQPSIDKPISQKSIEIAHSDHLSQQQSFGLLLDENLLHNFSINLLDTEISTLEKMLEEVESPRLLEQSHTQMKEDVQQFLDIKTSQTISELLNNLELISQGPALPEPPPYDFRAELDELEEEQDNLVRGSLLQSLEKAQQTQMAANLNLAKQKLPVTHAQSNTQKADILPKKSNQHNSHYEGIVKEQGTSTQEEQEISSHQVPSVEFERDIRQRAIGLFKQNTRIPEIAKLLGISRVRVLKCLPDEVIQQRIDELRRQELSYSKIGEVLGINRKTIAKRAKIYREQVDTMIEMFQNGDPVNQIAHKFSIRPKQVTARIPDSIKQARVDELYQQNLSVNKISEKLGIARKSVKNWVKKYNLKRPDLSLEKEKIEKLYLNPQLSMKDIAKELNLSERTVFRRIKAYGIQQKQPRKIIDQELTRKIITDHLHLQGMKPLAKKYGLTRTAVRKILVKAGVNILSSMKTSKLKAHLTGRFLLPISNDLSEILNGELLGDGGVYCQSAKYGSKWKKTINGYKIALHKLKPLNVTDLSKAVKEYNELSKTVLEAKIATFQLHKSKDEIDWVYFLAQKFEQNKHPVKIRHKNTVYLWSNASVQLYKLYQKWYPDGKKIVPRDLKLTPQTVLHWYIGDGSYIKGINDRICLYTLCFDKNDNNFLSDLLSNEVEVPVKVWRTRDYRTSKIYYCLNITRSHNIRKFLEYLGSAPEDSLSLAKDLFPWKFFKINKSEFLLKEKIKTN